MSRRHTIVMLGLCAVLPAWNSVTTLGGQGFDAAYSMALDNSGNIYIAGDTDSQAFGSAGRRPSRDGFIAKLDPSGSRVLYVSYFGGSGTETVRALAVDAAGNAYVAGSTNSLDFITTPGAVSGRNAGFEDAFAVKLNAAGTVVYSTLLGSSGFDQALGIAVDGSGNIYIAGQTTGSYPTTAGAFQPSFHGGTDCFVSKVNPNAGTLIYSTLLGGSGFDSCRGIAVDAAGNAYVTGVTYSPDFPIQAAMQSTLKGWADAFIAKLAPSGATLVYSTFLGGDNFDEANAIAVDPSGSAYVAGDTTSWNFPVSSYAAQGKPGGGYDAFVTRLSPAGDRFLYATLIGGGGADVATAVTIDVNGRAVISGFTSSPDLPVQQPVQGAMGGYTDAFAAVVDVYGSTFLFSTYLGGSGDDRAYAAAAGSGSWIYFAGLTQSPDVPGVAPGAVAAGNTKILVAQISGVWQDPPLTIVVNPGTAVLNPGQMQQFTAAVSGPGGITWSVNPPVGNIDANGLYTAPFIVTAQQTVSVTATSVASGMSKTATVTLLRPASAAQFVRLDTTTQGSWKGVYGGDGYNVINNAVAYPSYVNPIANGAANWASPDATTELRALQQAGSPTQRIVAMWYTATSSRFVVDLPFSDPLTHQLAVYCLDWGTNNLRAQQLEILDARNAVLDSRTLTNFSSGMWVVWNVSGHVQLRVTNLGVANAVISGLFFGPAQAPPPGKAHFVKQDMVTEGSWKGVYGGGGYNVAGDTLWYPPYMTPVITEAALWSLSGTTFDARALQQAGSTTQRIVAMWYTGASSTFVVDLPFTDSLAHELAVYCLDWGTANLRAQKLEILDSNNTVLDSRTLTNFSTGTWMVWDVSGYIQLRVTNLGVANSVVSGLFWGPGKP